MSTVPLPQAQRQRSINGRLFTTSQSVLVSPHSLAFERSFLVEILRLHEICLQQSSGRSFNQHHVYVTVSTWQYWDTSWVFTSHQFASHDQCIPHDQCTRSCLSLEHASSTRRSSSTSRSNTPVFNWLPSQVTEPLGRGTTRFKS